MQPSKFWDHKLKEKQAVMTEQGALETFHANQLGQYIDDTNGYCVTEARAKTRTVEAHRALGQSIDGDLLPLIHELEAGSARRFPIAGYQATSGSVEFAYLATLLRPYLGRRICEIGPGYGGLARALIETRKLDAGEPPDYSCVDFEPMRSIQKYYLESAGLRARWIQPGDDLPPAELYVNTRSMFEMTLKQIGFYLRQMDDHMRDVDASYFFSLNRDKITRMRDWPIPDAWACEMNLPYPMRPSFTMKLWTR